MHAIFALVAALLFRHTDDSPLGKLWQSSHNSVPGELSAAGATKRGREHAPPPEVRPMPRQGSPGVHDVGLNH